jgi:uridine kinase
VVDDEGKVVFKGTWMRLARRTVRDAMFRSWEPRVTIKMWANVRRGEKLYISPFKDNANLQLDSSLPYEVSVMRAYALPKFQEMGTSPDLERYQEIGQLSQAFPLFEPLDEKYVAEDSLIREFIGGGIYDD